jgi:CHAT domain-containing protein
MSCLLQLKRIGQILYFALFPGPISWAFQQTLKQLKRTESIALQLRFDSDAVEVARYPWELIHDGNYSLVGSGKVVLTRYITYSAPAYSLQVKSPAHLVYVAPRPTNIDALGQNERDAILQVLQQVEDLQVTTLEPSTYRAFVNTMRQTRYQIIHYDGHGVFARCCPQCKAMNQPHLTICANCQGNLSDVMPTAYLAFEDDNQHADFISAEEFTAPLIGTEISLAYVSACQSATVRSETLFGGLAPALINAGIPAALGMQYAIEVNASADFANAFYTRLAKYESIHKAVAEARIQLFRSQTWFIPALYLRSSDEEGRLFVKQQ